MNETSTPYQALQSGAAYFVLPARHVSTFSGPKAADALNGLVTNDVLKIAVGKGQYAVALAPKGKVLADVVILRTQPETFLVETSAFAGAEWWSMIKKYVNPRLAQYKDESANYVEIGVYGPKAAAIVARLGVVGSNDTTLATAMEEALANWTDWSHASWQLPGTEARLIRAPHLGATPGFVLLVESSFLDIVRARLDRFGATFADDSVWQLAQLEAGRPVFGLDMDATTIPQEANLDSWDAISFEKGCYTGQETVARIHFRGHVNKHLRGLTSKQAIPVGAEVRDTTGKVVGDVRRSAVSPQFGSIAIAMIRRELDEGVDVTIAVENDSIPARIVPLPFTSGVVGAT
ncbi:MAG: glycine cleavage T C-terminal barrel domain-containing protein [Gemmatimonadaceae bacterium]